LKEKYKWKNLDSPQTKRNQGRPTEEEPTRFGDDVFPRPPDKERKSKS
jgi:hypothetical protein